MREKNDGEYCSNAFNDYCNKLDIKHEKIVPSTQQNNIVEKMNHTIMEKVMSMLSNLVLEKNFWEKIVRIACYLINRSPTIALDGNIPKEVWIGRKVSHSHLNFFGCEAFVHISKENRTKLYDKSMKCIFLGYVDGEIGYCLWDPIKHKIVRSRDVIFNES